jgi:hypothetical protein
MLKGRSYYPQLDFLKMVLVTQAKVTEVNEFQFNEGYLCRVWKLIMRHDDDNAFKEARTWEAQFPATSGALTRAYNTGPQLFHRALAVHDTIRTFCSGEFLAQGSYYETVVRDFHQKQFTVFPNRYGNNVQDALTSVFLRGEELQDKNVYETMMRGHFREALLLVHLTIDSYYVPGIDCVFENAMEGNCLEHKHYARSLWAHLLKNDDELRALKILADKSVPFRQDALAVGCDLIPTIFKHGFSQLEKATSAAQEYVQLKWVIDKDLRAQIKGDDKWMKAINSTINNQHYWRRPIRDPETWRCLLADPPQFETLVRKHEAAAKL